MSKPLPDEVRRAIELRLQIAKSSTSKLTAISQRVCSDDRVRGTLLYHGAHTGRWSGSGVQLHNLPSRSLAVKHTALEGVLEAYALGGVDFLRVVYDDPMAVVSALIRPLLIAAPGKTLVCADYSSIEGRVLAWLAGEDWVVDSYKKGLDPYIVAALTIFGCSYDEVTPNQRQIGKVAELACGYQGGKNAYLRFAKDYGMSFEPEDAQKIVDDWREGRPQIRAYWYNIGECFMNAIRQQGKVFKYRGIQFRKTKRGYLQIKLPSGRWLWYPKARIEQRVPVWGGAKRDCATYFGKDDKGKWCQLSTYGGKLTENIVQAVARDLLSEAKLRCEVEGLSMVLSVHDEIVLEEAIRTANLQQLIDVMCDSRDWADGLPVEADGWIGKRYRK